MSGGRSLTVVFGVSSTLLIIFYGAALANVIRGVPLGYDSYFFLPLWTNWKVGPNPGILDWYTVIGGVVALVALTIHGALYLVIKTEGALQERARKTVKHPLGRSRRCSRLLACCNHPRAAHQPAQLLRIAGRVRGAGVGSCLPRWDPVLQPGGKREACFSLLRADTSLS